jgi:hypothetical protein
MLVIVITVISFVYTIDINGNDYVSKTMNSDDNTEFSATITSLLEEGFFGGVKLGIAAGFYNLLHNVIGVTIFVIPVFLSSLYRKYVRWKDIKLGRAPLLEIHELRVLNELLSESLKEYEMINIEVKSEEDFCSLLPVTTLSCVIKHIYEYIMLRSERYKASVADQEILFFLTLITSTLESIISCIEFPTYKTEIVTTAKTVIVIMSKLILLLQGPGDETEIYDPTHVWFGKKGYM